MKSSLLPAFLFVALIGATPAATLPTPEPSPITPAVPQIAPGYRGPDVRPTGADVVGVTQQPFVGLGLTDAIGMALSRNTDLAVQNANTRIAGYQIKEAKGAYDVKFMIEPSVQHSQQAPQNAFFAGPKFGPITQNAQSLSYGVQGNLPTGGQYSVGVTQTRIDNNTTINAFNPWYTASLNVGITQPLLRGVGPGDPIRHQISLAYIGQQATQAQAMIEASNTLSQVENAYWNLVAAWRNVAIQEDALKQAVAQQNSNVRLAKAGHAAPIDAVESSSQVAIYQDNVFSALATVSELQNELKALIVDDPADPIWRANLMPTTAVLQLPRVPTLDELLANAMKNRPEVSQVDAARQQADANAAFAKNQALPQVDLKLGYQGNGFAGNALPPLGGPFGNALPPSYLGGTYGQAYGNMGRFPTTSASVTISRPIGNTSAKAALAAANEQQRIAKLQTAGVSERILFDVRNAMQAYQSALSRLYAAGKARESAQAVFDSEKRKFKNGESTTFLVTQRQVELVQQEGRELQAQTDLNKAIVELQRVDGSILSANNVQLQSLGSGTKQ